ncbi:hypothetical protein A3A71_01685 [Candidatus Berkelbacteria bacterium RIFCSPLOWO2_01_FULL_50_28]|uniref:Uncharacterized protein n=1 Tax=Candidatus Berkelbacteria bacterium RIFCSPLOWO2_01_FULL_50_28 TaxID=1797471 RepID=A0A1F5EBZ3_9BACT|nr:MAG: hypothetical protein A3F39_01525 [Candidatus Berkelbacteria bacterium RIFCSPHIGHO2_12_FULL_50_11]OGD64744.1 MAG: hypothetical protein A3A71_01685 [Candidatus Berkelbacteria bacterium RIFCSPLOWO2_01_FULL_50_28]
MQLSAVSYQQSAWDWIAKFFKSQQLSVIPAVPESGRKLTAESCQPINLTTSGGGDLKRALQNQGEILFHYSVLEP